jgi:nucleoid DNA-binding protein
VTTLPRKDRTVTRQDLAEVVTRAGGVSRTEAADLVGQVFGMISDALYAGDPVLLSGFGKFQVIDRAPRRARNVRAGHEMMIGARKVLVFKPAVGLVRELTDKQAAPRATPKRERADFG